MSLGGSADCLTCFASSADPGRAYGQRLGFQRGQVKALGSVVDVKTDHAAGCVEIDVQPVRDLARLRVRSGQASLIFFKDLGSPIF